jgi:hypothetical protein
VINGDNGFIQRFDGALGDNKDPLVTMLIHGVNGDPMLTIAPLESLSPMIVK